MNRESLISLGRHCPLKSWGWEEWIVNNDLYCGKRLHFEARASGTSLHFHAKKHETMFVESGRFCITIVRTSDAYATDVLMESGASLVIPQLTPHRIICLEPGVLVEFSTHHEDEDSYRVMR